MSNTPQVTTHYVDGTPSETRDMTPEEIEQFVTGLIDDETTK
jgi:hypothetical protein